jgi:8-oxo-dGTP pyrophosphatase MutT (NUDIX family)
MNYVGPCHCVVVVLHVDGSRASDIKLVLQREPRYGRAWFPYGSILPYEEHVDAVVRELHEETGLVLTLDDLTILSDAPVRVALPEGQRKLVYVFSAYVLVPYVTTYLRTLAQLEHVVTAHSTISADGSYVVPTTIDIDGLSLTPAKHGLFPTLKQRHELLDFGYATQWETFRRSVYTHQVLCRDDSSIPMQFLMYSRFTSVDSGHVWMLFQGYVNKMCGQTPTDFRMGTTVPQPTSLVYPLLCLRPSVRLRSIISFSLDVNRVNLRIGSWQNRNVSSCSE